MKYAKKIVALLLVVAMTASIAVAGTLAYLTDRDSKTNVFTVGNVSIELEEEFEQGSELVPGVDVKKEAKITNTGANDAYVWMTLAVPAALDNIGTGGANGSNENVLHWNVPGAFWEGYHNNQQYINSAIAAGYLPAGSTGVAADKTWNVNDKVAVQKDVEINGVKYNVYTLLYNSALKPGETTSMGLCKVYLDGKVDIDTNGDLYVIENGVATKVEWNVNTSGNPNVIVSAYGIQTTGLADTNQDQVVDVVDAYAAYVGQWGDNGTEYNPAPVVIEVSTSEELKAAVENAQGETFVNLAEGEYTTNLKVPGGANITITGEDENTVLSGQIASTSSTVGTVRLANLTYNVDSTIVDSTGISQTGKSAIALWGTQTVICENVTFNMSLANSTAITSWWDTGVGTSIVVRDCTFNCAGQRPIRATGNVTVENCTFNDPYRYAVQLTAKASTATELEKAVINFNNNTIVNGANGKAFVYGIQLEGADYGCNNCEINGVGNTIDNGGTDSAMYYCECGKVQHETIVWNVEVTPVHENP